MKKKQISIGDATAVFTVPDSVEEWVALLGADRLCFFAEAEYTRRARAGLRTRMRHGDETDGLQKFADEFRPLTPRRSNKRNEKVRAVAEQYLATATNRELEELIKKEARRRGIDI